jgi:hypothetical protein
VGDQEDMGQVVVRERSQRAAAAKAQCRLREADDGDLGDATADELVCTPIPFNEGK